MTEDKEAIQDIKEYMKMEMEASRVIEDIVRDYDIETINDSTSVVVEDLLDNVESINQEKKILMLTHRMGQSVGSEAMARFAKGRLEGMVNNE